jgi:hypothetical protein
MSYAQVIEVDDDVKAQVMDPTLDPKELEYCVTSQQNELRNAVAGNPSLPKKFALWMTKDVDPFVRGSLALNNNLDSEVIGILAKDKHIFVISSLASNSLISHSLLEEFAKHRSYIVRTAAGLNSNAPTQVLESLSRDLEWGVRASVAANQSTTVEILEKLSADLIPEVKIAVAGNPVTPGHLLEGMLSDEYQLRSNVLLHQNLSDEFVKSIYISALDALEDQDEDWGDDIKGDTDVRKLIAERKNLSRSLIALVIEDKSYYVRSVLAANLSLEANDLSRLALDENEDVREAVVGNPNSSDEAKATATLLGLPERTDYDD